MPNRSESVSFSTRIPQKPISFWIKLLCRPGLASRLAAGRALANLGPMAGRAIPALIALLADPELRTRKRAYLALLRLGLEQEVLWWASIALLDPSELLDESSFPRRRKTNRDANPDDCELRKPLLAAARSADLDLADCLEFFGTLLADRDEHIRSLAARVLRGPWLPAPPDWLEEAHGVDPAARRRAAHAAGDIGAGRGLPILAELIRDPEPSVRLVAAVVLGRLGADALAELAVALEDDDPCVRHQAAWALGQPLGPEAIGVLIRAMKHPDAGVRWDTIKAVHALGLLARDVLPSLEQARDDPDRSVATAASHAYRDVSDRIHGKSLRHWAQRLRDPRPRIRRNVARILVYAPRPDVIMEALTDLVRDPDPDARGAACYALEEGDVPLTHPTFLGLLHDPDPRHRLSALDILHYGRRGQRQTIVDRVVARLDDPDETVRNRALRRLIRIDEDSRLYAYHVLPLREGSGGAEDEDDRFARARATVAFGDWGDEGLAPLLAALRDPDVLVRRAAVVAIWRIGAPALEAARMAASDDDPDVRVSAAEFIGQCDPEALERLLPLLDDPSALVSSTAIEALGRFGPRAAVALPWLHNAVRGPYHPIVRQAALAALGEIDPTSPDVTRLLLRLICDPDPQIRTAAAEGLGAVNPVPPEVVPALAQALADPESRVRHTAVLALGRIGPRARAALEAMIHACSDHEYAVHEYARANLLRLLPPQAEATEVDAVIALLTAALHSGDWQRRYWAEKSLSNLAGLANLRYHFSLLSSRHRHPAAEELPPPGPFPAAAKALATAFRHFRSDVRRSTVNMFSNGREAAQTVLPELIETYRTDPDPEVRDACSHVFRAMGPDAADAVPDMVARLSDPDKVIRFDTAFDLTFIDPTTVATMPILIQGLSDARSWTRERAAEALGRIGPTAVAAVPALTKSRSDPDEAVRKASVDALERIQGSPPSGVDGPGGHHIAEFDTNPKY